MRIIFNQKLFRHIGRLVGETNVAIGNHLGVSDTTVMRWFHSGNPPVIHFARMCNLYHLNLHAFFMDSTLEGDAHNAFASLPYHDVIFDGSKITGYHKKTDRITCTDLALWMTEHDTLLLPFIQGGTQVFLSAGENPSIGKCVATPVSTTTQGIALPGGTTPTSSFDNSLSLHRPIVFNMQLMAALPSVLDINPSTMWMNLGRVPNEHSIIRVRGDLRMRLLVSLCNRYNIDILLFFQHNEYIPDNIYKLACDTITFHPNRIMDFVQYGEQKDILSRLGFSKQRLYRSTDKDNTPLNARAFVNVCNTLNVTPSYFFMSDEDAARYSYARRVGQRIMQQDECIERINKEKALLESRLRHLQAMSEIGKNL